ncbi:hypothetical protein BSO21_24210, partial [Paenibacillus odorifer]
AVTELDELEAAAACPGADTPKPATIAADTNKDAVICLCDLIIRSPKFHDEISIKDCTTLFLYALIIGLPGIWNMLQISHIIMPLYGNTQV